MIVPSSSLHKKHVLIIDDEQNLSQMLMMLLETRGYEVAVAKTGREALQKVSPEFDVILLDLILPDISGFEICRLLKAKRSTSHIPIIILSAQSVSENKVHGLHLGADDFLSKPCEFEELFARIEVALRRSENLRFDENYNRNCSMILELKKILDHEMIVPYFQPIYQLRPLELIGLEVLSRPVAKGRLAKPENFFRFALQFGLYQDLELLCWEKAFDQLTEMKYGGPVFLNCNPFLIEGVKFTKIRNLLENCRVSPDRITLEITERSAITDYHLFYERIKKFKDFGIKIAVDDVGGGYASLESIVLTKPNVVKIDQHIIQDLKNDSYKRSIVKFIVLFAKENKILVVAEGVETKEDLAHVRDLGVDAVQGFYLNRPATKFDIEKVKTIRIP